MAKFVQVGYGSDGRGVGDKVGGYTYIVNNSVRAGDLIVPIPAYNTWAGRDINTTAKVLSTTNSLDRKGEKDVTVPNKKGGGDNNLVYSNEDVKNELADNGLVELDEDGKIADVGGIRNISNDGYKPLRSYGDKDKLKQQVGERQQVAQEKSSRAKELTEVFRGDSGDYAKQQRELSKTFSGETFDSYVKRWKESQGE